MPPGTEQPLHLHLFLSSPGDVTDERALAREVIERIQSERAHRERLRLEIVAWDKPGAGTAMPAHLEPQEALDKGLRKPSACEIVIVIFGYRMGTPLSEKHCKPDGERYWSGTEYEFLDALNAARQQGIPDVLVYRKQGAPDVNLDDPQFEEKKTQWQRVKDFFAGFKNLDGSFGSYYKTYATLPQFKEMLDENLRDIVTRYLEKQPSADSFLQASRWRLWTQQGLAGFATLLAVAVLVGAGWLYANDLTMKHGTLMLLAAVGLYHVDEPEMVEIPAGEFQMGSGDEDKEASDDEKRQHKVIIAKFVIGRYEVTFDEYDQFAHATGRPLLSDQGWGRGRRPVINVSWEDAKNYADWLSKMTGKPYRLPTEAEWEYAARAGSVSARFWGDDPKQVCQYANVADQSFRRYGYLGDIHECDDSQPLTAEVGSFKANDFELHDMLGNVWEWVQDTWRDSYEDAPDDGSVWEGEKGGLRVLRGGSWGAGPRRVRGAARGNVQPGRYDGMGFRLARD